MKRLKVPIQPFLFFIGLLLVVWGSIGWFLPFQTGDPYYTDTASNVFYLALGLLLAWSGFAWAEGISHDCSTFVGVAFLALAVAGFAVSGRSDPNLWVTNLENPADNVVHLVSGVVFVLAGRRVLTEEPFLPPRRFRTVM